VEYVEGVQEEDVQEEGLEDSRQTIEGELVVETSNGDDKLSADG